LFADVRARNRGLYEHIVGAADEQEMLDIVAANDDKLAVTPKLECVDNIHAALTRTSRCAGWRPYSLPEQKTKDVQDQESGEQKRHNCAQ
jgi:hypothetical protein